jgi:hypothetical protein
MDRENIFLGQLRAWNIPYEERMFIISHIGKIKIREDLESFDIVKTMSFENGRFDDQQSIMTIEYVLKNSRSLE